MALGRAMKEAMGFRKSIKKGPDISMTNPASVKGKSIKTYKTETVKDGAKPNYIQDNDSPSRAAGGKMKLIV